MKVILPISGVSVTSKDILPASCTKQPAVNCTAVPKANINQGYSNQEIYEGLMNIKKNLASIFSSKKDTHPINYIV